MKKNVALDKENKRVQLAFKQSMVEKEDLKKELTSQSDTMNHIIKQNSNLNDELKAKAEIIKLLKEDAEGNGCNQNNGNSEQELTKERSTSNGGAQSDEGVEDFHDDEVKCNQCDFKTRVRKYMKSHKMKHEGQYQCQRGCNEKFKTHQILDKHHKSEHSSQPPETFKCDICNDNFTSQQKLRQHNEAKHLQPREMPKE